MRFEQTRDILDHARAFHSHISQLYLRLAGEAEKGAVKMLLDYMGRHERNLEEALIRYEQQASEQILDTWFQYTHDEETLHICEASEFRPDMTVKEVVAAGLKLDDCLIRLYREMAEYANSEQVRDVFRNLLEMEEREKHKLSRNALQTLDV